MLVYFLDIFEPKTMNIDPLWSLIYLVQRLFDVFYFVSDAWLHSAYARSISQLRHWPWIELILSVVLSCVMVYGMSKYWVHYFLYTLINLVVSVIRLLCALVALHISLASILQPGILISNNTAGA